MASTIYLRKWSEPMNLNWNPLKILAAAGVALVLAACDPGPAEKAGKAVDRAGEKLGDKVRDIAK
jgi:hypothetical protein